MHPLNNKHFGSQTGKMAINFHDGNSTVTGYIVKQTGTKTFVCAANSTTTFVATLAQDAALAAALTKGFATINATPFGSNVVQHVSAIQSNLITTAEGNHYTWKLGNAVISGQAGLQIV
jgi:hypothetical protein